MANFPLFIISNLIRFALTSTIVTRWDFTIKLQILITFFYIYIFYIFSIIINNINKGFILLIFIIILLI